MRICVCGSRSLTDYALVKRKLDKVTSKLDLRALVILHGGATGADKLADRWVFERSVYSEVYHADWDRKGKQAGILRNIEMLKQCSWVIAFWDGKSSGTKFMIDEAPKYDLKLTVFRF